MKGSERRAFRTRNKIKSSANGDRPRLSVHRSSQHIYAQIIDDVNGATLAAASSVAMKPSGNKTEVATKVGAAIADAAKAKGITKVVFDRGSFRYHGRVKALADAAREAGLDF